MLNIPGEYGKQSVTFVTVADTGEPGYLGVREQVRTETVVSDCRFRPFAPARGGALGSSGTETSDAETNIAGEVWKLTAPPVSAVLNATPEGELLYDGDRFKIVGPMQPKRDMGGVLHHVTVMCRKQVT